MNEQIRSILAQETTKTSKIRQLYLLGVPRAEIARMVTNGNYGFVVNALRRMNECGDGPNIHPSTAALDYAFNRKFGIEIEAYNCSRERLARELKEAGIEVTVEGYNHTTRPHWKLVTDSSLSGNDTFELLSPILVGETGLRELEKVCWVLDLCDVKVNESCGLHVYIDATGFNMETWRNLALSYKHLEPVIDRFMPASRRDNRYCRGLGHVSDEMIRSARTVDELKGRIGDRYHKVNLEAYSRHKTVEFRQHSGTTNFTKMRNWVLFLHKLVTFATMGTGTRSHRTSGHAPSLTVNRNYIMKLRTQKTIGMNKHMYILADGGRIVASDPSEFVRILREGSWFDSECTDEEYMVNFSGRYRELHGVTVRTDTPEHFMDDLKNVRLHHGLRSPLLYYCDPRRP